MERPDTRQFWKRELSTLAQYSTFALLAVLGPAVVAYIRWEYFRPECTPTREGPAGAQTITDCVQTINWGDMWENEKPVFYIQLFIFAVLALLRLLLVVARRRSDFS